MTMNAPSLRKTIALSGLALLLGACQNLTPAPDQPALKPQHIVSERKPPGCQGSECPLVNIDTLSFAEEPALNQLIDQRLRAMTRYNAEDPLPVRLDAFQRDFLNNAEPRWSTYLQAKIRDQHAALVTIELSSYLYRGGAHGMPGRGFIIYDRKQDRELRLADLLLPGQTQAFWQLAEQAHQRWLVKNEFDRDAEFKRTWPFQRTEHIALLRDQVLLKYDVYSLAPYSSGHPELSIPLDQLKGVLRPEFL